MAEKHGLTEEFTKGLEKAAKGLSKTERKLLPGLDRDRKLNLYVDREAHNWIVGLLVTKNNRKLSEVYRQHLSALVDLCVEKNRQEEFYYALDQMNQFQMTSGLYRRSLRSESYTPFVDKSVYLLWAYARLRFYRAALSDVLLGKVAPEIYKDARSESFCYGGMLAAQIDRGEEQTIQAVKEVLLGDQNTQMITYELIRGIVMSKSEELYRVLGEFLLAARLLEGARQAVCETMDAGRKEAFLFLLQVIEEHDLIRYSSVRRAVSTWIGIYESDSTERISKKLVLMMGRCLREPAYCEEQLTLEDSVGICCALWAKGFYDAEEAVRAILGLADHGTKNQMMIASYYVGSLESRQLQQKAAKKIWFAHPGDLELTACYLPYFLGDVCQVIESLMCAGSYGCHRYSYSPSYDKGAAPAQMTPAQLHLTREEALESYEIFKDMLGRLPKKGVDLHPCMVPSWYRVKLGKSEVAASMCLLAWVLQEEALLDEAASLLNVVGDGRHLAARLLLHNPQTKVRRDLLFELLRNPETNTRAVAYHLVGRLSLSAEDFQKIEVNMRYKKSRKETLELLKKQDIEALLSCIGRLLHEKSEESHMGALELSLHVKKQNPAAYRKLVPVLAAWEHPTEKEQLLLSELVETKREDTVQAVLNKPGYGLYDPKKQWVIPKVRADKRKARELFTCKEEACLAVLQKLEALIEERKELEYRDFWGEEQLLGIKLVWNPYTMDYQKDFPLRELWEDFYKREINKPELLLEVKLYLDCVKRKDRYQEEKRLYQQVFGTLPFQKLAGPGAYEEQITIILEALFRQYVPKEQKGHWGLVGSAGLFQALGGQVDAYMAEYRSKPWRNQRQITWRKAEAPIFQQMIGWLDCAADEDWESAFALQFQAGVNIASCVEACVRGIWDKDMLYQAVFHYWKLEELVRAVSAAESRGGVSFWKTSRHAVCTFFGMDKIPEKGGQFRFDLMDPSAPELMLAHELYEELTALILKVELRRGEEETPFSKCVSGIYMLFGVRTLVQILKALGKDPLKRSAYGLYGTDRQTVLCQLLKVCHPGRGETASDLGRALKGSGVTRRRLAEVAMYARQWIPMLEEYLQIPGLKSGCYYFMAHTSEGLEEDVMAVIARYTPMDRQMLCSGAFDVHWFREAYEALGEKDFKLLYDAAKYSAAGSAHARARKYADAALGHTDFDTLVRAIGEKRNKDLLMSLPLLPLPEDVDLREQELLRRYQYIREFQKESRQFGAQRRSSEKSACEMALQNLSINAGYEEVTRLLLRMESRLTEELSDCFVWQEAEDVQVRVLVEETGNSRLVCQKEGKLLKSVPAKYKKQEAVVRCQATVKKLREQYQRTRRMFEQAMEDGTWFLVWELQMLGDNPVAAPVLKPLLFLTAEDGGQIGFLEDAETGLRDWSGAVHPVTSKTKVRVAHPWDLYQEGHWQEYQKLLFQKQIRQPFKQVFRELYVKLPQELEKEESRLFAGYQIQPRKTVATLGSRGWVADYESGLQKIYYKENIVAVLYALADWFSPADIEAPTLEAVAFYDRKTFQSVRIKDIPERIYSEVMRDADLAVSTAYVGGVDPEASHSTVEMRRAMIQGNLELFRVENVRLQGNHALIDGKLGQYTIHLGSGVVHQAGNAMLQVLPVHAQHRGKIFLPFVDEDPKTAEILSKILMFAEDQKIKDPAVIRQIR